MKPSEAIEKLKDILEEATETEYAVCYVTSCDEEPLRMAIEALEKQIPKSMDLEGDGYADGVMIYDTWICPCCSKAYEVDYDNYKYCPECGQAIDWGDTE